jgi:hypothetical protein
MCAAIMINSFGVYLPAFQSWSEGMYTVSSGGKGLDHCCHAAINKTQHFTKAASL